LTEFHVPYTIHPDGTEVIGSSVVTKATARHQLVVAATDGKVTVVPPEPLFVPELWTGAVESIPETRSILPIEKSDVPTVEVKLAPSDPSATR
jgi:hypothetical protein